MTDKAELQRNASKIALAGLLTVSLCGAGLLGVPLHQHMLVKL